MTTCRVVLLVSLILLTHSLVGVDGEYFSKLTESLSLNVTVVETNSVGSVIECSRLCSRNAKCQFFSWSQGDGSCVAYRPTILAGVSQLPSEIYLRQGAIPCPLNRMLDNQGRCICANGQWGALCKQQFTHNLLLTQLFPGNNSYDADHIEIDGISYLIILSKENGTTPNLSGFFSIYSREAGKEADYHQVGATVLTNSYARGVSAFHYNDTDYFLQTNYYSFPYNVSNTPQVLYSFDPISKQFVEKSRFQQWGSGHSSFYQRSNGDLYMCLAVKGALSPYIFKFNSKDASFNKTFTIPMNGSHYVCRFFEINNQLYTVSQADTATTFNKIYRLNPDETWSWHQDIPSTNYTILWSYDVYNTDDLVLLVASFPNSHKVIVYKWDGAFFNSSQTIPVPGTMPVFIRFLQVASDLFLLLDCSSGCLSFGIFKYDASTSTFNLFTIIGADGPFGGFKPFWYNDALHLLVVNNYNGSMPSTDPNRIYASNQLFRWE